MLSIADKLRRRRPQPGDKWYLDEVFIRIRGVVPRRRESAVLHVR